VSIQCSIGKDSSAMLHLAMKAFYPSRPPFPLLHVDTTWRFRDMLRPQHERDSEGPRVLASGESLVDHPARFGDAQALGIDEVLFVREGSFHRQHFSTSIVDVGRGQLSGIVPAGSG
jgi:hypothetical protein